ncbi:MAG TPA: glycoside hydrolase family 9 protein [Ignavibacteriales bacterium]|nr:glycoside hydrolase family 9 protein [Ignavibacteriales bacterium]
MKSKLLLLILFILPFSLVFPQKSWIRINQLGYLNKSVKVAVLLSKENLNVKSFELCDALTGKSLWKSNNVKSYGKYGAFESSYRLNFSDYKKEGAYYLKAGDAKSPSFRIANDVYNGTADFLLKYMRQQQCGYNPFIKDSCHTHDGFIIFHPDPKVDSTHIDVVGGWHDASDYLQYVTTSANAVFEMLFAYEQNPESFGDEYDKDGNPGANGIPDILDQAKWGMDWLVKMNPSKDMMFNQIADDRDHAGFKMPSLDPVSYGKGKERPVYFCTATPQGVFKNKNRSTGLASTAGKYAAAFSLGSEILAKYYPEFAKLLKTKAVEAYELGVKYPGVCQTAPCVSPYFYEEDNWVDDMELAATQLYQYTGKNYLKDAAEYGKQEPVTPWMGADTARHYQWYPFLNLGHYFLAKQSDKKIAKEFTADFRKGIDNVYRKGKSNPFLIGIPFIWCSNNLVSAMLTQSHLYYNLTKDDSYQEMEAALRDWLFGCNPWGTSMIMGLPKDGDNPTDPHSAFSAVYHMQVDGGLVDGPVYTTIFNMLKGLTLHEPDEYAQFQGGRIVYHDDYGDYSTDEPTMDGTASLTYYLGALQAEGKKDQSALLGKKDKTELQKKKVK